MRQKIIFLLFWLTLVNINTIFGQTENGTGQRVNGTFEYEDCDCSVKIKLKIHNGLYGDYGGQAVSNNNKITKGAVTVANLNDTDGNGIADNIDNTVKGSANGRNEVDLMKLEISFSGVYIPACPIVELITQGSIKLWQKSTKEVLQSNIIPISSLPLTVWVEATNYSTVIRDISIKAVVAGSIKDEVKATAIWAELIPTDVYYQASSNPIPSTIGLDADGLLNTINNNHLMLPLGMLSKNADRYGFGTFAEGNMPSKPNIDLIFGGKILFRFKLLPKDAYGLGNIFLDIARRKTTVDLIYNSYTYAPVIISSSFPIQNEEANDDPQTGGAGDYLDEDKIPNADGYIFSFDSPGTSNGFNTTLQAPPPPIAIRDLHFEEFVRVSFGTPPIGDILAGTRSSVKQPWSLNCANYISTSNNPSQPFNDFMQSYSQANAGTIVITKPKTTGPPMPNDGNGSISISALNNTQNTFFLQYDLPQRPKEWRLLKLSPTGALVFVAWSTALVSNTGVNSWVINSTDVTINIVEGSIKFSNLNEFTFKVLLIPSSVTNQLNNF